MWKVVSNNGTDTFHIVKERIARTVTSTWMTKKKTSMIVVVVARPTLTLTLQLLTHCLLSSLSGALISQTWAINLANWLCSKYFHGKTAVKRLFGPFFFSLSLCPLWRRRMLCLLCDSLHLRLAANCRADKPTNFGCLESNIHNCAFSGQWYSHCILCTVGRHCASLAVRHLRTSQSQNGRQMRNSEEKRALVSD